jgi:hypothetical protein
MIFVFAVAMLALMPDQSDIAGTTSHLDKLIDDLRSDEIAVREKATGDLKKLPPSAVPSLRLRLSLLRDVEAIARLREIIQDLLTVEGKRLYGEGNWEEALLVFAEAAGSADPRRYVEERRREARSELLKVIPTEIPAHRTCGGFISEACFPAIETDVRSTLPWGIPVLLEMMGDQHNMVASTNACTVLQCLEEDAAPALCWALNTRSEDLRLRACAALRTTRKPSTLVIRSFRDICSDPSASEYLKDEARKALPRLEMYADINRKAVTSP